MAGLGLSPSRLDDLIVNRAKLWLDAGRFFGGNGDEFQRMVLACSKTTLEQALCQLEAAVKSLKKNPYV